ncbi:MAG: endonuclease III [Deltaproteobacteria bacterium]|nr:endonuclease III [Deltaproteobacteria bacterium]
MKRKDKAARIQDQLDELYPTVPIPLDHTDAFTLLVAVVLSAQTTDKKVNEVTPELFAVADTPEKMAEMHPEDVRQIIRQIGLSPSKSKALVGLSTMIRDLHGGQVPRTFAELEAMPGVGHKTASVVMAQAFGVPAFPVDTHIHRLAARWGLSSGKNVKQTEKDLKAVFAKDRWNDAHLQIIYFGREYCPALYHELEDCPICGWAATKKRIADERKETARKKMKRRK